MSDDALPEGDVAQAPLSDEQLKQYVELWKQTIAVQQHFNDLEWKIRGFALTALTFTLGAAAVAAREPAKIPIFGGHVGLPALIIIAGLIIWCSFWFVDAIWYHPLLIGSVKHGEKLESELRKQLPEAGLTAAISETSAVTLFKNKKSRWEWRRNPPARMPTLHSKHKLRGFYAVIAVLLGVFAYGLRASAPHSNNETPSLNVRLTTPSPSAPTSVSPEPSGTSVVPSPTRTR